MFLFLAPPFFLSASWILWIEMLPAIILFLQEACLPLYAISCLGLTPTMDWALWKYEQYKSLALQIAGVWYFALASGRLTNKAKNALYGIWDFKGWVCWKRVFQIVFTWFKLKNMYFRFYILEFLSLMPQGF